MISTKNPATRKWRRRIRVDAVVLDRSVNLTFHGIGRPSRRLDAVEQNVWMGREQFLALLDCVADRGDVTITFDDGNSSDLELALPALQERGLKAIFFVVAGRLGMPRFLDEDGVRELEAAGMEIGCHGMRHRPWRRLDARAMHEELEEARAIIEQVVRRPVRRAACPFGSYDRRVLTALRSSGYQHVYTSDRGTARSSDFLQARNSVGPSDEPRVLERILALESKPNRALRRRAKLAVKRWR